LADSVPNIDLHEELLSVEENECPNISCNPYDGVEPCDLIIREAEDRVYRKLKSRRKKKSGKGKGKKKKRSNANALRSLKRLRRKNKKYVKSITRRVYVA